MGKKIRLKRKSTIAVLSILACLVGLASWMAAFYHTNHLPYQIPDKIYQAGDFVPVGNNYFISPDENPDGYSVQVNDAKLLTYQQLFEQYNLDYHEYSRLDEYGNVESNYVYDIELNISNTDNTTGYIFFGRYLLVDKSLTLFYNSTIQALVYPELADVGSLRAGHRIYRLAPVARLADARTVADPAVGYAAVFCHVLEQHRPVCSPGGREPAGGRACRLGNQPASLSRAQYGSGALHRSDAIALPGNHGAQLSGIAPIWPAGHAVGHHFTGHLFYISGIYHGARL